MRNDWPRDSGPWLRLLRRLSSGRNKPHNDSYRGWGWTPRTSSWVEPTSFALIALSLSPIELLPTGSDADANSQKQCCVTACAQEEDGIAGIPIYGVPGDPLVIPTVWALVALRDEPERTENVLSLDWLEKNLESIQGPGSLALAQICIETYGRKWPRSAPSTPRCLPKNEFLQNIPVIAWTCLASGTGNTGWRSAPGEIPMTQNRSTVLVPSFQRPTRA